MWLRNFDLGVAATLTKNTLPSASGATAGSDGYNLVRNRQGYWRNTRTSIDTWFTQIPAEIPYQGYMQSVSVSSGTTNGFCFGTGTTAPTYDDYNLENYIDNAFTYATSTDTTSYSEESKKFTRTITADFYNSSGAEVTVQEIGLGGYIGLSAAGSRDSFLLMREVLSTPVTVAAGEYIRVTLSYEVGAYPSKPTVMAEPST